MAWTTPKTWAVGELVTAQMLNTYIRDAMNAIVPLGTYILRAATYTDVETAEEDRWLQCNGVAVSRGTYAALFGLFNSLSPALPFGAGNGTTTFNLPDFRGRSLVAEGTHADVDSMGDSEGAALANRRPKHYHNTQYGGESIGGFIPTGASAGGSPGLDTAVTRLVPTTPGSTNNTIDTPSYLVFGSVFIKYV